MYNFHIFTDSSCDLPLEMQKQYDLKVMQLEVIIDDKTPILNKDIEAKEFYRQLREGANAKTAAVTPGYFEEHMRKSLEEGADILYIGFSSGLSTTYNSGAMVMKELQEEFPQRILLHMDTLCASVGQGLLVHYAALQREAGKTVEEVYAELMEMKDKIHHQVTVDDLFFLKRGGRISTTAAVAGSLLKLKPMIVLTKEGKLENVAKAHGRKKAIRELIEYMNATADIESWNYVFISHGDCPEEAMVVKDMVEQQYPKAQVIVSDVGPVIGAHTGPGVIALCHMGRCTKGTEFKTK